MGKTATQRLGQAKQKAKETDGQKASAAQAITEYGIDGVDQPEVWNVISSGPSRHQLTEDDLLPDAPVVAINSALDVRERFPVHVWAFWDGLERVAGKRLKQWITHPLVVWMGPNRFYELFLDGSGRIDRVPWETGFDYRIGFRHLDRGLLPDPIKGGMRAGFSLIYILEKCIRLGAKKIRVLSCDMSGPWVPGTTTEEASKAVNRWDRWSYEKAQIRTMCMLSREKRGCDIELYGMDMEKYLQGGELVAKNGD